MTPEQQAVLQRARQRAAIEAARARLAVPSQPETQRLQAAPMADRIATAISLGEAGRTPESIARQQAADAQAEQMLAEVAGPRAQMARGTPGGVASFILGATQGATFGGADELAGGMRALGAAVDPSMTMGEGYALGRDRARGMLDAAERERPFTTGLGTAAGGVATALTYGLPAMAGRGLAGATAAGAGLGAVEGAAYGYLSGEGGAEARAANMVPYGAMGLAGGAFAPSVIRGAEYATRPVRGAIGGIADRLLGLGGANRAGRALNETMERAGLTADDVAQRLTVAAREGQPEFRVMDALGIPGARRASGVVRAGEEGSEQIRAFLEQRQAGQGDRVAAFIGDAFDGSQTAAQMQTGMRAARDQIADAQYAAARAQAGPVDVRGALQVIDDYIGPMQGSGVTGDGTDAILSRFRSRLAAPSGQLPSGTTSVELSDFSRVLNLKRDVQDAAEAAFRAGRGNEGARLNDLWRALDASLEASSPAYRAANDAYRESSRVMGAIETGQEIATRPSFRAEDVADTIARMTPEQQAAARVGFGDRALARIDATAGPMTNRARPFLTPRFEAISNQVGVDPALLMSRLQRENAMFATNATALGGSRTADNLADAAGVEGFDSSVIANLLTGRFNAAAGQVAGAASDFFSGVTPNTRMLIAEALLSNDVTALRAAARRADVSEAQRNIIEALMRVTAMQQGGTLAEGEY